MRHDVDAALDGLQRLRAAGHRIADEVRSKFLLTAAGIQVPDAEVVPCPQDAPAAAGRVGLPVAVKLVCPDVPHESEISAVEGPISAPESVAAAAERLWRRRPEAARGLLVERWHEEVPLCSVGLMAHATFGPVVAFGLGGVWVEVLRDVAFRLAPVSAEEAYDMIGTLRAARLLLGPPPGKAASQLADVITTVGEMARDVRLIDLVAQLDINPLCPTRDGPAIALDCSIVLR